MFKIYKLLLVITMLFQLETVFAGSADDVKKIIKNNFNIDIKDSYDISQIENSDIYSIYKISFDKVVFDSIIKSSDLNGWSRTSDNHLIKRKLINKNFVFVDISLKNNEIEYTEEINKANLFYSIGASEDDFVFEFIDKIKLNIKNNDISSLEGMIKYPLQLSSYNSSTGKTIKSFSTKEQFKSVYKTIITDKVRKIVMDSSNDDLIIKTEGVGLGGGVIWIKYGIKNEKSDHKELYIGSINQL